MTLRLDLRAESTLPMQLCGVMPSWACRRSLDEIERWTISIGNQFVPLAEAFAVSGDPSDSNIEFRGDIPNARWLGARMSDGTIRVEGSVGRHAGAAMSGGELIINGDAGDWLGCQMKRGRIRVSGNAGDFVAAAPPGERRGMTGGEIFIAGNVGDEIGRRMRRGLIVVGGAAGDSVGLNLLAGTILVFGRCGPRPGSGMRRGTIGLFTQPPEISLSFRPSGRSSPVFMRLLLNYLRRAGFAAAEPLMDSQFTSFDGDLLTLGKGEILLRSV
jgi:formylmethanofuran dehydrogenase subunit C